MTTTLSLAHHGDREDDPSFSDAYHHASRFRGLPQGGTRWRLAAALRTAAKPLGLTASMLGLLEHYIDLTYDIDWTPGSEPIIGQPLVEIAAHFGKTERQIRNLEHSLAARGLLAWRDSANHRRKRRRDHATGRLLFAYGPTLAPLGARYDDILALAQAQRHELAAIRSTRHAIGALRARMRRRLQACGESSPLGAEIAAQLAQIPCRLPASVSIARLEEIRNALADLCERYRPSQATDEPEICCRPHTETTTKTSQEKYGEIPKDKARRSDPCEKERMIGLHTAIKASGHLIKAQIPSERTAWSDFINAAAQTAIWIGISKETWSEACCKLGRHRAALCVSLIENRLEVDKDTSFHKVRNPNSYLIGMIRREQENALNLNASIYAILRRKATYFKEVRENPNPGSPQHRHSASVSIHLAPSPRYPDQTTQSSNQRALRRSDPVESLKHQIQSRNLQ